MPKIATLDEFWNDVNHGVYNFTKDGNLGRRAYGFELKKEFVDGFYEKLFPLIQEDMFTKAEREDKRAEKLRLFSNAELENCKII